MSDKIYLSRSEQKYLMEMLEINDPIQAAEKFAYMLVEEKADPSKLQEYVKKIMNKKNDKH